MWKEFFFFFFQMQEKGAPAQEINFLDKWDVRYSLLGQAL